uniref:hypothetical protein n=1 Tax=Pseudomonas sp. Z003-0.4C(8344-21) TaxID=1855380 RepID=UPI0012FD2CD5|nr:hypothetical protein [Pseudomonas sp. Z003-0.4C(8344-21)]
MKNSKLKLIKIALVKCLLPVLVFSPPKLSLVFASARGAMKQRTAQAARLHSRALRKNTPGSLFTGTQLQLMRTHN